MSAAHTPGPWVWDSTVWDYDPKEDAPWLVTEASGDRVLHGKIQCPSEANARLIAAAPDLLEAIELFVAWSKDENHNTGSTFWGRIDMLRDLDSKAIAAIAKATGATT